MRMGARGGGDCDRGDGTVKSAELWVQSPRANPPRGAKDDAHRLGKERARTLDSDRALNVPLRQKEGGLKPPELRNLRGNCLPCDWQRRRLR